MPICPADNTALEQVGSNPDAIYRCPHHGGYFISSGASGLLPIPRAVMTFPGAGEERITNAYIDGSGDLVLVYESGTLTISGGAAGAHNVLSATHSDAVADTLIRGDILYVDSTPELNRLAVGAANTVLKSDATDVAWGQVAHGELSGVTSDLHHAQVHAASHSDGGTDEVTVENLATSSADVSTALRPDGAGGVAFSDVGHADLTGVSSDQHHAQTHAASHSDGGADETTVENLATASADVSTALRPDGAGGVAFSDVDHTALTGVSSDQHHAQAHNLPGADHSAGTLGETVYAGVAGAWTALSGNTTVTKNFLNQTGDGANSAAPAWGTIMDGDVPATHSGSAHHAQTHAATHSLTGADEVTVEDLRTASTDTSNVLKPSGANAVAMADLTHAELSTVTSDQHHAQLHAASHAVTAGDDIGGQNMTFTAVVIVDGAGASLEVPNAAGGRTVNVAGEVTVDSTPTGGSFNFYDGTAERALRPLGSKSITIESPTATEDIIFFHTEFAITVQIMRAVTRGTTPSVTWTVRFDTDRSAAGTEVVTGGTTTTSATTGDDITTFDDATIPADSWVWIETTAQSGTVGEIGITVHYTMDA